MFYVNLKNVLGSDFSQVVKDIAFRLSQAQYMSLGDLLKSLSQDELDELMRCSNAIVEDAGEPSEELQTIVLVAEMVAQAEGGDINEPDETRVASFVTFLAIEGLNRKGVVKFKREKASLVDPCPPSELVDLLLKSNTKRRL